MFQNNVLNVPSRDIYQIKLSLNKLHCIGQDNDFNRKQKSLVLVTKQIFLLIILGKKSLSKRSNAINFLK